MWIWRVSLRTGTCCKIFRDTFVSRNFICANFFLRDSPSARHPSCATLFQLCDILFAWLFTCATSDLRDISFARHFKCATSHLRDIFFQKLEQRIQNITIISCYRIGYYPWSVGKLKEAYLVVIPSEGNMNLWKKNAEAQIYLENNRGFKNRSFSVRRKLSSK